LDKLLLYKTLVTSLRDDPEFLLREYHAQPQHEIPLRHGEPMGDEQPQLAVFTDFECPACYCNLLAVRKQIAEAFDGQLGVLVRHYPLCNTCNGNVRDQPHPNACEAAYAAEAARLQGGDGAFWQMYDLLFQNRKELSRELYRSLAVKMGLDADRLLGDMDGDTVRRIVESDISLASELGVTGTPTMFLNGRRVTELCRGPVFWEAIAEDWSSSPNAARDAGVGIRGALAASDGRRNHPE
jgi:predicted DsbA family dithiol-disulfide isomerase